MKITRSYNRSGSKSGITVNGTTLTVKDSNKPTLSKLDKAVKNLKKKAKEGVQWLSLNASYSDTAVSRPYTAYNLLDYANCRVCFGTAVDDLVCNKWYHSSTDLDLIISAGNEMDNVALTIFIVKLKDEASSKLNTTTGVLTLTNVLDYVNNLASGDYMQAFLNPALFDIKFEKRFSVGNNANVAATGGQIGYDSKSLCRYARFSYKLNIGKNIENPNGNVATLLNSLNNWRLMIAIGLLP